MQAAFGGVRIHRAAGAVFGEDGAEPFGVVSQMRQRHRAVLDKRDRLALLLHRHHDIEAGGAEIRYGGLCRGLDHIDHAAPFALRIIPAETQVRHQFGKLFEFPQIVRLILFGKFDDQQRVGIAPYGRIDHRSKHRNIAAECDHGAVDQFHRNGAQLDQVLGCIHRLVEAAEVADPKHLVADDRPQLQLDLGGEGECTFRADQKMRHVVGGVARHQRIEIVAADPALHLRKLV